jgi:SAM-dependent methyltransferase
MFPQAELTGCDLSAVQLKSGFTVSEQAGVPIHFKQRDGRATGEPDASFDLVVQNAVAHELPPKANIEVFKEMFRILKPGGDLLLIDPPPFRAVDIFSAMVLDWDTDHREEPFFASALLSDWPAELAKLGFQVRSHEVFEGGFPWVLVASKPLRA